MIQISRQVLLEYCHEKNSYNSIIIIKVLKNLDF